MLTIKAMVKKDGMRVDRKYNVNQLRDYSKSSNRSEIATPHSQRENRPLIYDFLRFLLYLCHVIDDFACLDLQH